MKKIFCAVAIFMMSQIVQAQYDDANSHIGISGGYSYMNILTDNFKVTPLGGFNVGFSTRGMFYDYFDLVYGMEFFQTSVAMEGYRLGSFKNEQLVFMNKGVQVHLLGSYRAISDHLNFDFGPVFQLNDRLTAKDSQQEYILEGTPLKAVDVADVSKFNVLLGAGVTGGSMHVRASLFYQYGLTNFFSKLNKTEPVSNAGYNLKGNLSLLTARVIFYL
jgi:hypothetical protein